MRILQALPLGRLTEFRFLLQQLESQGIFNLSEARQAVINEENQRHTKEKTVRRQKKLSGSLDERHKPERMCSECGAPMSMQMIKEENITIAECINKACWFSEIVPNKE